jgi:hypothetical protein
LPSKTAVTKDGCEGLLIKDHLQRALLRLRVSNETRAGITGSA